MVDGAMLFSFPLFLLPFSRRRHSNMFDCEDKKKKVNFFSYFFCLSIFVTFSFFFFVFSIYDLCGIVCPNMTLDYHSRVDETQDWIVIWNFSIYSFSLSLSCLF